MAVRTVVLQKILRRENVHVLHLFLVRDVRVSFNLLSFKFFATLPDYSPQAHQEARIWASQVVPLSISHVIYATDPSVCSTAELCIISPLETLKALILEIVAIELLPSEEAQQGREYEFVAPHVLQYFP